MPTKTLGLEGEGTRTGTLELEPEAKESPRLNGHGDRDLPRRGGGMKRWKKNLLIGSAVVALVALVVGGIAWSKKGQVTVQTGKVMRQELSSIVTASGEIKPPPEDLANVNANSYGKITELLVKEGDHVKKGQLLLRTEDIQQAADVEAQQAALKTAQADLDQAQAKYRQAKDDFTRAQGLVEDQLIAQQAFDQRRSDYKVAEAAVQSAQARVAQNKALYQQATYSRDMASARVAQSKAQLIRFTDVRDKTVYT